MVTVLSGDTQFEIPPNGLTTLEFKLEVSTWSPSSLLQFR
jgi:hypothetical protein